MLADYPFVNAYKYLQTLIVVCKHLQILTNDYKRLLSAGFRNVYLLCRRLHIDGILNFIS